MSRGHVLDTSILIELREGDAAIIRQIAQLQRPLAASVVSVVELYGGLDRIAAEASLRRQRIAVMLARLVVLDFTAAEAQAYRQIVEAAGYSRRKLLDRMIAAQAVSIGATLVTLNPQDFEDVPGLVVRVLSVGT
ncbi:MAG: PIN domain-containing protein [Hyphomonadaceae bacterium]|nr:PIN domain-containing protein [Hyphomonadaceae bacterium]